MPVRPVGCEGGIPSELPVPEVRGVLQYPVALGVKVHLVDKITGNKFFQRVQEQGLSVEKPHVLGRYALACTLRGKECNDFHHAASFHAETVYIL